MSSPPLGRWGRTEDDPPEPGSQRPGGGTDSGNAAGKASSLLEVLLACFLIPRIPPKVLELWARRAVALPQAGALC